MFNWIVSFINWLFCVRQDVAVAEYAPEVETDDFSEWPALVYVAPVELKPPRQVVSVPKMSWAEFKANNAMVNQYFTERNTFNF